MDSIKIVRFGPRRFRDYIFRLYPPYRRKQDENTRAAIKWLCQHPEAPVVIGSDLASERIDAINYPNI